VVVLSGMGERRVDVPRSSGSGSGFRNEDTCLVLRCLLTMPEGFEQSLLVQKRQGGDVVGLLLLLVSLSALRNRSVLLLSSARIFG